MLMLLIVVGRWVVAIDEFNRQNESAAIIHVEMSSSRVGSIKEIEKDRVDDNKE